MVETPGLLEAYEHDADFLFPKWAIAGKSFGEAAGQRALEHYRRRAAIADGQGSCAALAPGLRFALEGHTEPELNREWTAIDVRHRLDLRPDASSGVRYENRFECIPSDVAYPARRPSRRPAHVAETGTVVGPAGEEIHVDAKARVRVHFHWDRRGPTETSSCWLRTMQTWSGPGWGSQFIPRVGMVRMVTRSVPTRSSGNIIYPRSNNGEHGICAPARHHSDVRRNRHRGRRVRNAKQRQRSA